MRDMKTELETILRDRFGGIISYGTHTANGRACALELASQAQGIAWTDDPERVGYPDLRPLNDARWSSDAARTAALLPVLVALADWRVWPDARRVEWMRAVALRTIREVLSIAARAISLGRAARRCETAGTLGAVRAAARAAAGDAGDAILILATRIWVEAAYSTNLRCIPEGDRP